MPLRAWNPAPGRAATAGDGSGQLSSSATDRSALGLCAASGALLAALLRRRSTRLQRHAWGDDVVYHSASVLSNVEAAEGLRLITVEAPEEVVKPFAKAGQYVMAKPAADAKPSFYSISSPFGGSMGSKMEFLIKLSESNAWMTGTKSGDALQLSPAMGRGFSIDGEAWKAADVSQVGIFASGSGIAPMRAAIESGALAGKVCRLYYGARSEAGLAYADRFDAWRKSGVEVVPVLSQGGDSWGGRQGYIQDAFKQDEERGEGFVLSAKHGALICGQKEMVEAVRQVYSQLGVPEERTLLNF
ncbi:unnamed protein product [Polarella glacialis]|uniref:Oxidoreductase FAD/NAD(P)-binding domain-containing protein n=1 Tax=Polarella glacialis TaxID=89957 RepID=A0A813JL62_POLGL|nr:unnamed protein product [Polarella glacialis]